MNLELLLYLNNMLFNVYTYDQYHYYIFSM